MSATTEISEGLTYEQWKQSGLQDCVFRQDVDRYFPPGSQQPPLPSVQANPEPDPIPVEQPLKTNSKGA